MGTHPIAPTAPPLLPPNPVVVFITVDALRGDVVNDTANDTRFPTLARLKEEGVVFAHASAPGAQTVVSISALFSGAYFSEQPWTSYGHGRDLFFYPIDRRFRSFPEALTAHGIPTANYPGLAFLRGDYGVVRGFGEEHFIPDSLPGSRLIDPLLDRLARCGSGPLFLYTHLLEPHQPYGGVKGKNDYDAYLSAVSTVDRQLGRVLKALERAFEGRWALFVSADHGEAFGEHGTREHGKTLYEELLHVPLLARSPRFPPRVVTERVGLVDIGPTILDLFGLETPPSWNGETLVPLLAGKSRAFTRPLVAEGRLRRALTLPEGLKVIDDPLRKVVEVYDLAKDPDETRNLFDADPVRSDRALAALRSFFAAHAWREGAYEPPYLP
jgi:arylsulfatase A-like enzyme